MVLNRCIWSPTISEVPSEIGTHAFKPCTVYVDEVVFVMLKDPLTTPRIAEAYRVNERDPRPNRKVWVPLPYRYPGAVRLSLRETGVGHAS
jgi:hypothetical protein